MNENLKSFLEAIQNDEELKKKVEELDKKSQEELRGCVDEYIALAKEYGIVLTEQDFKSEDSELNEEEIQAVAAGEDGEPLHCHILGRGQWGEDGQKDCFCFAVGGVKSSG